MQIQMQNRSRVSEEELTSSSADNILKDSERLGSYEHGV